VRPKKASNKGNPVEILGRWGNPTFNKFRSSTVTSNLGRVAQAFDLAGISNRVGALSFAVFAKGGRRESLRM
jgi:hypothetical protein